MRRMRRIAAARPQRPAPAAAPLGQGNIDHAGPSQRHGFGGRKRQAPMRARRPMAEDSLVPAERIEKAILLVRGHKVMLDSDLAELYGVTTFNLNKAVKRNRTRFPDDFLFQLTKEEAEGLRFQSG